MSNFRVRGGVTPRRNYMHYVSKSKEISRCLNTECSRISLKRIRAGIYRCKCCGFQIAGKCYSLN